MSLARQTRRTRSLMGRSMKSKEAYPVSEDTPPTNNGIPQEQTPARQDVDVFLDVPELEVDRIGLTVRGLRAHVSILAELAGLVNLQVGVDARLDEVELEIEGVRAKVLLKVRLDEVRAILNHALNTLAEHPEILRALTRALNELVDGLVGSALGTLENVLGSLEVGETVDELLKGRLEDARDTLQDVLEQAGAQAQEEGVDGGPGGAPAGSLPSSVGEAPPPEATPEEDR
jgi:exonuclease VII small subunit